MDMLLSMVGAKFWYSSQVDLEQIHCIQQRAARGTGQLVHNDFQQSSVNLPYILSDQDNFVKN